MLARVQVEHEADERPLERGAGAEESGEARPGELRAALEVEDAELGAQVPVRLGLEVEVRGSPTTRSTRLALSSAPRGTECVREVGQRRARSPPARRRPPRPGRRAPRSRPLSAATAAICRAGVAAGRLDAADRLARLVAAPLELLQLAPACRAVRGRAPARHRRTRRSGRGRRERPGGARDRCGAVRGRAWRSASVASVPAGRQRRALRVRKSSRVSMRTPLGFLRRRCPGSRPGSPA